MPGRKRRTKNKGLVNRDRVRERTRQKAQEREGGTSTIRAPKGAEFWKPQKKGTYYVDILPFRVGTDNYSAVEQDEIWYEMTFFIHRGVGTDEKTVVCPLKTFGKRCPICEEYNALRKDEHASEEVVKALRPKERQIFNVRIRGEEGVKIFEFSNYNFGLLLMEELEMEDTEENMGFFDIVDGKTLKVRFKDASGGGYTYLAASKIDFVDRDDMDETILEETHDLTSILNVMTYDQLDALMNGAVGDDEEEDDEEDAPPAKKKRAKKSPPPPKDEDDEDDEDDDEDLLEDDDDDDDEEPEEKPKPKRKTAPKRKSRSKKPPVEEENDEEDDDEDEDDEDEPEEKPKKRTSRKSTSKKTTSRKKKEEPPEDEDDDDDDDDDAFWDDDDDDD